MAETTEISWCDATVNIWWGCSKVSPACKNCYAATLAARFGQTWGSGAPRTRKKGAEALARKLNRKAEREGRRLRVFAESMGDWLDHEVPAEWLAGLLATVARTPHLDWLLLSKRPHLWRERLWAVAEGCTGPGAAFARLWVMGTRPPNVWVGTTVEDQQRADERIPHLLAIPAVVRFLSCEPLLGPVDLKLSRPAKSAGDVLRSAPAAIRLAVERRHFRDCDLCEACRGVWCEASISEIRALMAQAQPGIDQVIIGGESGHGARPMDLAWARALRDQCAEAGTACFVKQLGGARDKRHDIEGFPEDLRLREVPRA